MRRQTWLYRLLTSGGPLVAVVLVVLDVAVVTNSWRWWRGDALWAVQQFGSSIFLALPVVLVLYAVPPVLAGGTRTDVALMAARPGPSRRERFAVDLAPAVAAHLLFVVPAVCWARANGDPLETRGIALSVLAQLLVLGFVAAIGRGVAEQVVHPAAILLAAAGGVVLIGFAANALPVTAGSSPYAGLTVKPTGYLIASVVLLGGVVLMLTRASGRLQGAAMLATALVAVVVAGTVLDEPDVEPSGAVPTSCRAVSAVEVCAFPGYGFMRDQLARQTDEVLSVLADEGIDPHLRLVAQSVPGVVEGPGEVSIPFVVESLEATELMPSMVRGSLIHPNWCPLVNSPDPLPRRFDTAELNVFQWLSHAAGAISDADYRRLAPDFSRRSTSDQRRYVQTYFDDIYTCNGLT